MLELYIVESSPIIHTYLFMFVQVPNQLLHSDVPFDDESMECKHMFVGIIALQSGGTALRVCPRSHHHTGVFEKVMLVELDKYEFIVCHPKLIHGGCGAESVNWRLHFYHGIPKELALKTDFPDIIQKTREEIRADACAIAREARVKSKNVAEVESEARVKSKKAAKVESEAKVKSKNATAKAREAKN